MTHQCECGHGDENHFSATHSFREAMESRGSKLAYPCLVKGCACKSYRSKTWTIECEEKP